MMDFICSISFMGLLEIQEIRNKRDKKNAYKICPQLDSNPRSLDKEAATVSSRPRDMIQMNN